MGTANSGQTQVPCKLQDISGPAGRAFRVSAADLPVKCKLLPAGPGTQIASVQIINSGGNLTTVSGLPGTAFTLPKMAADTYDVAVFVAPSGQVDVVEDCSAQTLLLSFIPGPNRLNFDLVVV